MRIPSIGNCTPRSFFPSIRHTVLGTLGALAMVLVVGPAAQAQGFGNQTLGYAALPDNSYAPGDRSLDPNATDDALESTSVVPDRLKRTTVTFSTHEAPGTIVIDTANTQLYYVLGNNWAIRYGVGVGREGFTWSGVKAIARKAEWPDWHPPRAMIARQPYLPRFMAGGPGNPLGAAAMYLGSSDYRIHGTNDPSTIGKFVSSGCIRLTNEDIRDLYSRVRIGAKVIVLPKIGSQQLEANARRAKRNAALTMSPQSPLEVARLSRMN